MPLATILVVCALVASPPSGAAASVKGLLLAQENQPAQDPQATSPPTPAPPTEPEAKPAESSPPPQTSGQESSTQPATSQPDSTAKKPAAASQPKKHRRKHKPVATGAGATKTVVPNGSTPDPKVQIAPSLTEEQASHQRQNTTQLLASTDANLKKIAGRQLSASQQDVVKQIHTYMAQAKVAEDAGDLQRARNLAFKAHLLSDELLKH
jgi:hypothetical protein